MLPEKVLLYSVKLLLLSVICFGLYIPDASAQLFRRKGQIITYRNNKFEQSKRTIDTVEFKDPATGKKQVRYITHYEIPVKVNGRPIYKADQLSSEPVANAKNGPLELYILKGLEAEMNKLPDGDYYLDLTKMVVATTGKVIYFENRGFKVIEANEDFVLTPEFTEKIVPDNIKNELDRKLDGLFAKAPLLKPGQLKGKNATALSLMNFKDYKIVVKDHKATFSKK